LWYSGQPEKALNHYDRIVENMPSDASCLMERGQVLVEVGQPQKALTELKTVLEQINSVPNARDAAWPAMQAYTCSGLGTAFAALGDYSKAFDEYQKSIDLQADNAWVYFNRAHVYEKRASIQKLSRISSDRSRSPDQNFRRTSARSQRGVFRSSRSP
jgi:tetratricopeptide (TPR) repeat protein